MSNLFHFWFHFINIVSFSLSADDPCPLLLDTGSIEVTTITECIKKIPTLNLVDICVKLDPICKRLGNADCIETELVRSENDSNIYDGQLLCSALLCNQLPGEKVALECIDHSKQCGANKGSLEMLRCNTMEVQKYYDKKKPIICPIINPEEKNAAKVRACVVNLSTRSITEYCRWNPQVCNHDGPDCSKSSPAQNGGITKVLCAWRVCDAYCWFKNKAKSCLTSCLDSNEKKCEKSTNVQAMVNCHVNQAQEKGSQLINKVIRCPLLKKNLDNLPECVKQIPEMKMEVECKTLESACKYADTGACKKSMQNPLFDMRLLCVATLCNRVCSTKQCVADCLGSCDNQDKQASLLCHLQSSATYYAKHKPVVCPFLTDKMKPELVTACIQQLQTIDMIRYCHENTDECDEFLKADCQQAPLLKESNANTSLACIGLKCWKTCRQVSENMTMDQNCRKDCIGDGSKCSDPNTRIHCLIQGSLEFIKKALSDAAEKGKTDEKGEPGEKGKPKPTVGGKDTTKARPSQPARPTTEEKGQQEATDSSSMAVFQICFTLFSLLSSFLFVYHLYF